MGIAAARAGAAAVTAAEIDLLAGVAIQLNAAENGVRVTVEPSDLIGRAEAPWDAVLAGDMCYERPVAEALTEWLRSLASRGTKILLGDPGRAFLPKIGLNPLASYTVPTDLDLESRESREGVVYRMKS